MIGQEATTTGLARVAPRLIGEDPAVETLRREIGCAAAGSYSVLLLGESGSGKEVVARSIHEADPLRAAEPFLPFNCGACTPDLLPSTLFGHRCGAFTGALADRDGVFAAAGCGTLFLDEIAEMPLDLQVQLLRAIDQREVTPLGSNESTPWSARLVCATNRDLAHEVASGRFREDLYYRINVVALRLPSLRERPGDIALLAEHFLGQLAGGDGRARVLTPEAIARLLAHDWPGNVRELRNVLERACAMSSSAAIASQDLGLPTDGEGDAGFPALNEVVRDHIHRALAVTGGVRIRAAELLGVDRNRLARMIRRLGIDSHKR